MSFSRGSSWPRQCGPITLSAPHGGCSSLFPSYLLCPSWCFRVPAAPPRLVTLSSCAVQASSSPWNPTPAPVSGPSLLLPIPAIVVLSVGIYLLLLGLVLLTRHCLLVRGLVGAGGWALTGEEVSLSPHLQALTLRHLCHLVSISAPHLGQETLFSSPQLNLLRPLSPKPRLSCPSQPATWPGS